ncbi:MAG: helicase, partial [Clostridiales bacterium]|nr:helicase [Clostridiales bacterium]
MRTNDFYTLIELVKREVLDSEREYLKLLKVIGNNQRYDFLSQLSIYDRNPKAVACASFDMWRDRFHRTVMRGEKGIPILYESEGKQKIAYVFDISQTVSIDRNVNEVELWSFDKEKDTDTLKEMIRLEGYTPHDSLLENIYFLSRIYADQDIYELVNNLRVPAEDRNAFVHFMRESISYALSDRFHVEYPIDIEKGKENFLYLDSVSLMFAGNCISNACNRILEATIERTKKLSLSHGLTKNRSEEYNKSNPEEVRLETERNGEAEQGGMGDAVRSNDERDDDRGERVFSDGEYGRNSEDNQEENF